MLKKLSAVMLISDKNTYYINVVFEGLKLGPFHVLLFK